MTFLTILFVVVCGGMLVAGAMYFRPSRTLSAQEQISVDTEQTLALLASLQQTLAAHAGTLDGVQSVEGVEVDRGNLEQVRASNRSTRDALVEDNQRLNSMMGKYDNLYRAERGRIETYAHHVSDLDNRLDQFANDAEGGCASLLQFVREMVKENRQLQTKVADCQEQVSELIAQSIQADRLARTDALTQLPNRRAWDERLDQLEDGGPMAVALIDVNDFKDINDAYGHAAGDAMLTLIGTILRNSHDVSAFRIGGDEFALLMQPGSEEAIADRIANKIAGAILQFAGEKLTVTVSIGTARRSEGDSVQRVLRRADDALYDVKAQKDEYVKTPQLA